MGASAGDVNDWVIDRRLHGLLLRGGGLSTPVDVVRHLTAVQAQEHAYARWSVAQRLAGPPTAATVDAAFAEGEFVRTHVLRPTWHYVAAADLGWLMALSGPRVDAAGARQHHVLGLDGRTLGRSNELIGQSVGSGARTRRELLEVLDHRGLSAAGLRGTYMLMHAELTGVVCSGPMRGKQHTYASFDQRVGPAAGPRGDEALGELAWRYFSTRGPATLHDFSWWSGLRVATARLGLELAQSRLEARAVDGRTFWFAEGKVTRSKRPRVDLVQAYDEMIISYSRSRDVLNATYTTFPPMSRVHGFYHVLLLDGRALGHWRAPAGSSTVQTRISKVLDGGEQAALAAAIEGYMQFVR
jgi:Winged helix DNA-binding domain